HPVSIHEHMLRRLPALFSSLGQKFLDRHGRSPPTASSRYSRHSRKTPRRCRGRKPGLLHLRRCCQARPTIRQSSCSARSRGTPRRTGIHSGRDDPQKTWCVPRPPPSLLIDIRREIPSQTAQEAFSLGLGLIFAFLLLIGGQLLQRSLLGGSNGRALQ